MGVQAVFLRLIIEKHADIAKIPTLCSIIETAAASQPKDPLDWHSVANGVNPLVAHGVGEKWRAHPVDDGKCRSHRALLVT